MKRLIIAILIIYLMILPIFRWNLTPDKYKFSIIESLAREDIPTIELIIGNIYSKMTGK